MEKRRARDTAEILGLAAQGYEVEQDGEGFRISFAAPENTPYAPARLTLCLVLAPGHPWDPPCVRFAAPVPLHPNVDASSGAVCVGAARRPPAGTWTPVATPAAVVAAVVVLLGEPNADDALDVAAAALLRRSADEYAARARLSVSGRTHDLPAKSGSDSPARLLSSTRSIRTAYHTADFKHCAGDYDMSATMGALVDDQPVETHAATKLENERAGVNIHRDNSFLTDATAHSGKQQTHMATRQDNSDMTEATTHSENGRTPAAGYSDPSALPISTCDTENGQSRIESLAKSSDTLSPTPVPGGLCAVSAGDAHPAVTPKPDAARPSTTEKRPLVDDEAPSLLGALSRRRRAGA